MLHRMRSKIHLLDTNADNLWSFFFFFFALFFHASAGCPPPDSQQPQAVRTPQDDCDQGMPRPRSEDQAGHTYGQTTEHETLRVRGALPSVMW